MPTNDERREVARKLRDIGYLGNFGDTARAIGFTDDMTWRMDEVNARLADLIDPGDVSGEVCEIEGIGVGEPLPPVVDRDALLALADDLTRMSTANGVILEGEAKTIARKIREAVGG